jgi:hypothetical protein
MARTPAAARAENTGAFTAPVPERKVPAVPARGAGDRVDPAGSREPSGPPGGWRKHLKRDLTKAVDDGAFVAAQ